VPFTILIGMQLFMAKADWVPPRGFPGQLLQRQQASEPPPCCAANRDRPQKPEILLNGLTCFFCSLSEQEPIGTGIADGLEYAPRREGDGDGE
jgi:hypothetical protein